MHPRISCQNNLAITTLLHCFDDNSVVRIIASNFSLKCVLYSSFCWLLPRWGWYYYVHALHWPYKENNYCSQTVYTNCSLVLKNNSNLVIYHFIKWYWFAVVTSHVPKTDFVSYLLLQAVVSSVSIHPASN